MPQPFDDDSTIRLVKPDLARVRSPRNMARMLLAAGLFVLAALTGVGWMLWRPSAPPPAAVRLEFAPSPPGPTETAPSVVVVPPTTLALPKSAQAPPDVAAFSIETATEPRILDHVPTADAADPTVFRFQANPRILVLDFKSLLDQGHMLNRVAALSEKSGLPHDRLLSDNELDAAIRAGGDTAETFYYGHDYGASELLRFFALGDRDNVRLMVQEDSLRRLIRQDGWFEPNPRAALISIPQVGADTHVTRSARATILHHELSHGEYFTNPDYAAFAHHFWTRTLTAAERDRIRAELHSLGYDSSLEEVMENEAQAYLMFTDSAEFFTPEMFGLSKARVAELRRGFLGAMPPGWLHDSLAETLGLIRPAAAARPSTP